MRLTIQVSKEVAQPLARGETANPQVREILRLGEELGLRFQPLHPQTGDPQLARYFTAEVADGPAAQAVADRLREHAAVEAAYLKPPPRAFLRRRGLLR